MSTFGKPYVLTSAFGIAGYHGRKTARINDVRLSFLDALPTRFDRAEIQELIEEDVPPQPSNIIQVLARVSARTPTAAFDRATASMDLLRALWSFLLTAGRYNLFRSGAPRPTNSILPGPLHTLHRPNGSIIKETFWFEPQGLKAKHIYGADKNWPQIQKKAYAFLSGLRSIKYRDDLDGAFVRYVRTLDTTDYATAFSGMWSVLEHLTNSTGEYGRLIERVLFVTSDQERTFSRLLLEHLRDVRNGFVHEGETRSRSENYLSQVKYTTEEMFRFHLRVGRLFSSLPEAAEYLDTPIDRNVLKQRIRNYRRVLRRRR